MTLALGKMLSERIGRAGIEIGPSVDLGRRSGGGVGLDEGRSGPCPAGDALDARLWAPLRLANSAVFEPRGRFLGILRLVMLGGPWLNAC